MSLHGHPYRESGFVDPPPDEIPRLTRRFDGHARAVAIAMLLLPALAAGMLGDARDWRVATEACSRTTLRVRFEADASANRISALPAIHGCFLMGRRGADGSRATTMGPRPRCNNLVSRFLDGDTVPEWVGECRRALQFTPDVEGLSMDGIARLRELCMVNLGHGPEHLRWGPDTEALLREML